MNCTVSSFVDIFDRCGDRYLLNTPAQLSYGIVEGEVGLAYGYFYLYKFSRQKKYLNKLYAVIDLLTEKCRNDFSLGYGLAGLAWLIRFIEKEGLLEDVRIWKQDAEKALEREFYMLLDKQNTDYFSGASGILFYFLYSVLDDSVLSMTNAFTGFLQQRIKKKEWSKLQYTPDRRLVPIINLGVPHGMTGLLLLLLQIKEKYNGNIKDILIVDLLEELISYRMEGTSRYFFPAMIINDPVAKAYRNSGLAWCYGDLTAGYAILKAGILIGRKDYQDFARKILYKTLDNSNYQKDNLMLCHGIPSIYWVYNKLYKLTGDTIFLEASDKWKSIMLNIFPDIYKRYQEGISHQEFFESPSLFNGFPGVFMVLFTLEYIDDEWSRCFLL